MSQLSQFVIVTGMTGAGRGTAAKVLEKLGYYVIDNIPPGLLASASAVQRRMRRHCLFRSWIPALKPWGWRAWSEWHPIGCSVMLVMT